jgi:hypothetical protein
MRMAAATRELSDSLGLTGKHVFFNSEWVDFDDRQNYLLDADVGVSTHFEHVETTFSFRTRMLDYLWAGLPIVATGGDTFGDLVTTEGLGVTVPEQDVDALADALERTLYDDEFAAGCRESVARVRGDYRWETVLRPLIEFCRAPRRAPDLVGPDAIDGTGLVARGRLLDTGYRPHLRGDVALVRSYLQQGGPAELARRVAGRVRRRVAEGVRGRS